VDSLCPLSSILKLISFINFNQFYKRAPSLSSDKCSEDIESESSLSSSVRFPIGILGFLIVLLRSYFVL